MAAMGPSAESDRAGGGDDGDLNIKRGDKVLGRRAVHWAILQLTV